MNYYIAYTAINKDGDNVTGHLTTYLNMRNDYMFSRFIEQTMEEKGFAFFNPTFIWEFTD